MAETLGQSGVGQTDVAQEAAGLGDFASLWDFALRVYAQPGVEPACLALQDEQGADVCLLLWCLWLERGGCELTAEGLQQAQGAIAPWVAQAVLPLRALRRQLKARYGTADAELEQLRLGIKQAELLAERQVLRQLAALNGQWQRTAEVPAGTNLRLYLGALGLAEAEQAGYLQCLRWQAH